MPKLLTYAAVIYWAAVVYYWKQISNEYKELDEVLVNQWKDERIPQQKTIPQS